MEKTRGRHNGPPLQFNHPDGRKILLIHLRIYQKGAVTTKEEYHGIFGPCIGNGALHPRQHRLTSDVAVEDDRDSTVAVFLIHVGYRVGVVGTHAQRFHPLGYLLIPTHIT